MEKEATQEEDEANELYRDVNVNLEGRDTAMTYAPLPNVQATNEIEDTHVILTAPINPEGQQQSSSVTSGFVSNMLNPRPDTGIDLIFTLNTKATSLVDVSVTTIAEPPLVSAITLPPPSTHLITYLQQTPVPTPAIKLVNDQLESEVLICSSNEANTSHAVEANLSELELKKILIDKMEANKSIDRSLAHKEDPRESFNELIDTPLDLSAFVMNRLKVDTLTLELLADQLDWINPEGQQYPHDLRKPLPLIPNTRGRRVIPFDHFINNDLEYLSGGVSSRRYATSVTKTKAADYGHIKWIEDLVPNRMWSQVLEFARDVYSKRKIIAVTKIEIVEWHNYKHLDWITVRGNDDKLYKFKEGDFNKLRIQDIEDMLLLLVQGQVDKSHSYENERNLKFIDALDVKTIGGDSPKSLLQPSDRAQVESKEVWLPDSGPIPLDDQDVQI
ncbi:hypothetical protein Tco_0553550, partial [Tanacetum coccineum]